MTNASALLLVEQDLIDTVTLTPQCAALFEDVLGRNVSDCLLTDLSTLSDFTGSGMPADPANDVLDYRDYCRAWDRWVLDRIEQVFGVRIERTTLTFIQIVERLTQAQLVPTLN